MKQLAKQHGRELFLRAGRDFISSPPPSINAKTYSHWDKFVSGFPLYLERSKPQKKLGMTPEQIERSWAAAKKIHEDMWAIKTPPEEVKAEDFLASDEPKLTDDEMLSEIAAMNFKPIAVQNMREYEERKAKAEAEAKALDKAIEDGNF
jgi:hypothetical protein